MKVYVLLITLLMAGAVSCQNQEAVGEETPAAAAGESSKTILKVLSPADFAAKMKEDVQLVDVRRPEEYAAGHIEGAVNYNFLGPDFNQEVVQLDKNKPVLLYCRTGRRSGAASQKLKGMGFSEIYDLQGGYLNWQEQQGGQ